VCAWRQAEPKFSRQITRGIRDLGYYLSEAIDPVRHDHEPLIRENSIVHQALGKDDHDPEGHIRRRSVQVGLVCLSVCLSVCVGAPFRWPRRLCASFKG
jgi:hypothetical protein